MARRTDVHFTFDTEELTALSLSNALADIPDQFNDFVFVGSYFDHDTQQVTFDFRDYED